jgi:pimeloyl-ACP methyl ester carboxylesterase
MRRMVLILVVAVFVGSCSGASDSANSDATLPPATTQAAASGEIDRSFDVGGHKLHLRCEGTGSPGSPTVVYLHGLGGDGSDIKSINAQLASKARVCTYDRLNVGRSDSDAGRHTAPTASPICTPCWRRPVSQGPTCWSASPSVACWPSCTPPRTPTRSWGWSAWTEACPPTTRSTR